MKLCPDDEFRVKKCHIDTRENTSLVLLCVRTTLAKFGLNASKMRSNKQNEE
jgi:hypothetical protein